eukprot:CAMPEP_0181125070 /NCGR_PEP_ID=MMETSP1071-20121207/26840_1 /TAXON_ID=35127 /ORGANISM="Thalassiosira sp., Strain NH16" /LENGTH=647 /DNA_ID=CAMNT_0023210461 /DNA_START=14 /DNA_END=1958 /DNA_ORIENTATION=+
MSTFALSEIIPPASTDGQSTASQCHDSFDAQLRAKLEKSPPHLAENVNADQKSDDAVFSTVRALFGKAAVALESELQQCDTARSKEERNSILTHCHFVPGRIEVMGKHTDYAGGNSLVCATAGRGMAMVSTIVSNNDQRDVDNRMKVTIVSVLPLGMEHHATANTTAPYHVKGRPVVRHTINIPNEKCGPAKDSSEDCDNKKETNTVDWTIYPTAVIHRLHKNFGLFSHSNGVGGGHIFIALASNLPPASGLSTSSAFVTGLFLVLNSHLSLTAHMHTATVYNLSTYLGNVENGREYISADAVLEGTVQGGVGTFGGSEDHAAILMGRSGEMRLLSFCPTRPALIDMDTVIGEIASSDILDDNSNLLNLLESTSQDSVVQLSPELKFVIAYSGAKAEKAGGTDGDTDAFIGYNSASDLARKTFDAYFTVSDSEDLKRTQTLADAIRYKRNMGAMSSKQSIKASMSSCIRDGVLTMNMTTTTDRAQYSNALVQRFEHFYDESECLVPAAAHAISKEKYDLLGPIVDASHHGAVNSLKNQIAETAFLPLWARGMENSLQSNPLAVVRVNNPDNLSHQANHPKRIKALAASAFGAGFGGSCWALVYDFEAKEFAQQWRKAYNERFPVTNTNACITREFFITCPGPGAFCI